jgi:uncharacterized membrane-anchored protein
MRKWLFRKRAAFTGARHWLLLLVAAQALFLLAVAGAGYATHAYGQTIVLRTTPLDPRDFLYGDYVRLRYTISRLPMQLWREAGPVPRRGKPVYVLLRPAGPAYEAEGGYTATPTAPGGTVILRGWVRNNGRRTLNVRYNLEKYDVPEGTGRTLERLGARHPLLVHVSIAPWGQARITKVAEDTTTRFSN